MLLGAGKAVHIKVADRAVADLLVDAVGGRVGQVW